jgi:hypothetical protein
VLFPDSSIPIAVSGAMHEARARYKTKGKASFRQFFQFGWFPGFPFCIFRTDFFAVSSSKWILAVPVPSARSAAMLIFSGEFAQMEAVHRR